MPGRPRHGFPNFRARACAPPDDARAVSYPVRAAKSTAGDANLPRICGYAKPAVYIHRDHLFPMKIMNPAHLHSRAGVLQVMSKGLAEGRITHWRGSLFHIKLWCKRSSCSEYSIAFVDQSECTSCWYHPKATSHGPSKLRQDT